MKRNITLFILQIIFIVEATGQPDIKGIALCDFSSYMTGDTVTIRGYSYDKINHTEKYLVKSHNLDVYIPGSFIEVPDGEYSFWTKVWYMNRLSAITKNGWQNDSREALIEDFRNYISALEEDGLIYKDDYLLNYMHNLAMSIHPECLVKPDEKPVEIIMIRSIEPEIYAFDHGTIVISTGMIAGTNSEEELALLLAENTAHIVLEDNLANLNKSLDMSGGILLTAAVISVAAIVALSAIEVVSEDEFAADEVFSALDLPLTVAEEFIQPPTFSYSPQQIARTGKIAKACMNNLASENHTFRSCGEYGLIISSVIRDCAWDEYFRGNYEISEELIDKLINLGISDEEDWLLKTKNQMALKNDTESNLLALEYIEAAQQIDQYHLAEVLLVKGIILIRLERTEEAREVLNEFIEASEYAGIDESQIEEAKSMIADCDNLIMNR